VQAGDTITYTLVVRNAGAATQHNLVVRDAVPGGTTYVPGSSQVEGMQTVRDAFNAISFGNNDGSLSWSADWQEGEGDGPDAGLVRVREDTGVGEAYVLQVGWPKQNRRAWRAVDLAGVPSAVLSFDYRRVDIDANDTYWIGVSPDGGTTWDVLRTIEAGHDSAYHHASYDITPFISADTAIGFQSGFKGGTNDADYVGIDNVQIRFPGIAPGGDPPELISEAKGYRFEPDETLTVTFRVTVDDPPPAGLSEIVNTASVTSDELTEHVTDTAVEPLLTTAVRLAAFAAHPRGDDIVVTWETAMEIDNVGFHLYRARVAAGPYTRLNETLIPAQVPGSTFGAVYQWMDGDVAPGVAYHYRLEDLDRSGVRTFHGPVQAALPHVAGGEGHSVFLPMVLKIP
jgi:uncharacterized repeat protein (TIGR01451 family)